MERMDEAWRRARGLWRRGALEREMDEEIRFHLERQTEKNVRAGMAPDEARRAAVLAFGGVERVKESARDETRPRALEELLRDLRMAGRSLRRSPGFTLAAAATLALGIGATTALFSVVNGVLLKPLPYGAPDRIAMLWQVGDKGEKGAVSEPNYLDWRQQTRSFSAMAEIGFQGRVTVLGGSEPARATATAVSADFLRVMGVAPALGRAFSPDEQRPGGAPAVLVSHGFWQTYLGGARALRGRTVTVGDRVYSVVGVMPPSFDFPVGTQLWAPRELDGPSASRTAHNFKVVARLRDGATLAGAQRELSGVSRALKARWGDDVWMVDGAVEPLAEGVVGGVRPTLLMLFGAAGLLLLIACANVSNLLLARAAARRRELAVRLALGAGRWRVIRHFLAESLVLCAAGGVAGAALAWAAVRLLPRFDPGTLPRLADVRMSWPVLLFALGLSVAAAVALGLATSVRASGREVGPVLAEAGRSQAGGRSGQRVRSALVVGQVALTLLLLSAASLLGRSFLSLVTIDPGYRTRDALVLSFSLGDADDEATGAAQVRFRTELMERLRRLPGVRQVGGVNDFPLGGGNYSNGTFLLLSRPDEVKTFDDWGALAKVPERTGYAAFRVASGGYFRAMGIPLLRGRGFEEGDGREAPHVALVSRSLAEKRWPGQDPIGRLISFSNMDGDMHPLRIVGVVGDVREASLENAPEPTVYADHRQRYGSASRFNVVVQGAESEGTAAAARRVVRELDPRVPVTVRTAEEVLSRSVAPRRFSFLLLGAFAAAAMLLAGLGLYGVISYLVAQRTREIGIRMALGARTGDLLRMVMRHGAVLALLGTAAGLVAALAMTRLIRGMLYGVSATDPVAFVSVALLLGAVTLLATYLPARRAARVQPMASLRAE
jgi:putative ABC transport system permease protein